MDNDEAEKKKTLLVWFNGVEIETIRYAIFNYLDYDKFTNSAAAVDEVIQAEINELDDLERKFDHKKKDFEAFDGLKINLTVREIRKILKIIEEEEDNEKEKNNELRKDSLLKKDSKQDTDEYIGSYEFYLFYIRELGMLNQKFLDILEKRVSAGDG